MREKPVCYACNVFDFFRPDRWLKYRLYQHMHHKTKEF